VIPPLPESVPLPKLLPKTFLISALLHVALLAEAPPRFSHASVDSGLSQGTVQAIVQDHVGFLWLGTHEGLDRYDGYNYVVFKHDPKNPLSLADDVVCALFEDRRNRLWVGTEHGLSLFDRKSETFTRQSPIRERVTSILEGDDGSLWVASEGDGLYVLRPGEGDFVSFQPNSGDPQSLASFAVSSLLRDHWGRLWIGTRNAGIDLFEPSGPYGRFIHHRHDPADPNSLSSDDVWGLAEDGAGNIWAATYGGGLEMLDEKTGGFIHHHHEANDSLGVPTDLATAVYVDHLGTLWAGTDGSGLLKYDSSSNRFLAFSHIKGDPESLSENVVRSLYEDRQGNIWVGTYQAGCDILKKSRHEFGYLTHEPNDQNGLSDPQVASLLEDSKGNIWVGTEGGWINRIDHTTGAIQRYRFPQPNPAGSAVLSIHQDTSGQIWLGTYLGGLGRFDPTTEIFQIYRHDPRNPKSLGNDEVWAIVEDSEGILWLGTNDGLDCFDPVRCEVLKHYDTANPGGTRLGGVRALHIDHGGKLWIGTFAGLFALTPGQGVFVHFQHSESDPASLSNDSVVAIEEDSRGRLWVGTLGGGLDLMESPGKFRAYRQFPSNSILGIEEDRLGRLWLSTNQGLARFTPDTGNVENFNLSNGLESLQFHIGARLKTRSGRILFGSVDGLYNFDPESVRPSNFAPPIAITSVRIFNQPVKLPVAPSVLGELDLTANDQIFSLEYAALDFAFPRHNRYSYMMEGFNGSWIDMGERREVTFTNLDPGSYVFRVRASNSDGVWTPSSMASLNVLIRPPFWRTWWFRLGALGSLVALLTLGYRSRINRLKASLQERKRAEDALRESEDRYRHFFEEDLSGVFICGSDGRIGDCNASFARIFGYESVDQALNDNLANLQVKPDKWHELRERVEQDKKLRDYELEMRGRDGRSLHVVANAAGRFDSDGKLTAITGYIMDVSKRKSLEAQLLHSQKMEAVGQLVGGIAHDFNNLLTAIIGNSDLLLLNAVPGDSSYEGLKDISAASHRAAALTRQLLAYGRKQVFQLQIVELNALVSGLGRMLQGLLGEAIYVRMTGAAPALIKADPGQIEQVIMNLAINARDAMTGGGTLTIDASTVHFGPDEAAEHVGLQPGPYVRLSVGDTGSGISEEVRARLFEPFFTTKEPGKGTGLGLSMVDGIVAQSGGHIEVESKMGVGTTFRIYFPEEAGGAVASPAQPTKPGLLRGSETVLVAEDSDVVRAVTRQILEDSGYTVFQARDASEALVICDERKGEIDLLIADIVMPGMDGLELAERLAKRFPRLRILLTSGYPNPAILRHGGFDPGKGFLEKPYDPQKLLSKVREVLSSKP
jgi:PAS domain S-box-containing protein